MASESDGSEAATSVVTEDSAVSGGDAETEGDRGHSRAHLVERNRLLRQRVQEQAARIEALEAALERRSDDESAEGSPATSSATDDRQVPPSVRQRVQQWLARGPFGK